MKINKTIKVMTAILITITVLCTLSSIAFGANLQDDIKKLQEGNANGAGKDAVMELGGNIVAIVQTIGIVVAVVILLVLGIKYMMGSAEEKAEYKKSMIPYIVGAILIFASTTIVNIVYNFANGLNASN